MDIAVQQVLADGNVRQMTASTGGPWGGINVDAAFIKILEDMWGSDFVNHIKETLPSVWLDITNKFEFEKRNATPEMTTPLRIFTVTPGFYQEFKKIQSLKIKIFTLEIFDLFRNIDQIQQSTKESLLVNDSSGKGMGGYCQDAYNICQHVFDLDRMIQKSKGPSYKNIDHDMREVLECCNRIKNCCEAIKNQGDQIEKCCSDIMDKCKSIIEYANKTFEDSCDGVDGVQLTKDYSISLSPDVMKKLFMPTVQSIIDCMQSVLENLASSNVSVKYIFMVGGFSRCQYLYETVRSHFNDNCVLIPDEPSLAIVKGAIKLGPNPSYVCERIAEVTYGTDSTLPFDAEKHTHDQKRTVDGEIVCQGVFERVVKKGDRVHHGDKIIRYFSPFRAASSDIRIKLCQSTSDRSATDDEMYIKDDDVTIYSTLVLPLSNHHRGLDRTVEVIFEVGESELIVRAKDISDPQASNTTARIPLSKSYKPMTT